VGVDDAHSRRRDVSGIAGTIEASSSIPELVAPVTRLVTLRAITE
jgi:hypothetical protein